MTCLLKQRLLTKTPCFRAVIGGVLALVLLSTTYHVFQIATRQDKEEKETTLDIALKSFSLIGK